MERYSIEPIVPFTEEVYRLSHGMFYHLCSITNMNPTSYFALIVNRAWVIDHAHDEVSRNLNELHGILNAMSKNDNIGRYNHLIQVIDLLRGMLEIKPACDAPS